MGDPPQPNGDTQRRVVNTLFVMRVDLQLKQQLARELCAIIDGWTLNEAVTGLRVYPARISELRHGNLTRFSIGRLVRLIAHLVYDVDVAIRPTTSPARVMKRSTTTVVRYDRFGRGV
jgi:predicted XRE-type DNA-binding protein